MADIHAVWVGTKLSILEQLAIHSFQQQGHVFHLWLYDDCLDVPNGVVKRDAGTIMARDTIFRYHGRPSALLENGGIGSLGHWSDQFQMKLLYEVGGVYTQLDVFLLGPLDFSAPYIFTADESCFQSCFMKCPQGSSFAIDTFEALQKAVNPDTMKDLKWVDSMAVMGNSVKSHNLERYILPMSIFQNGHDFEAPRTSKTVKLVHFWNSMIKSQKEFPKVGSLYADLLIDAGLWQPTLMQRLVDAIPVPRRYSKQLRSRIRKSLERAAP